MLDEADALRYPDLLLLGQLRRQPRLAGRGVIHRNGDLLLKQNTSVTAHTVDLTFALSPTHVGSPTPTLQFWGYNCMG